MKDAIPRKNIAVIGAGPAGLMAAEIIAGAGHAVTVYDRMPSVGRKFLMAGRGGLNLTHSEPLEQFITRYRAAADWLAPALHRFPPEALRAWCEGLGQETFIGSSRRIFPRALKATPLLRAWLRRLGNLSVRFCMRHTWQGWEEGALAFMDGAQRRVHVRADATLLALGGASWPRLGSDGGWVHVLQETGIAITPLQPSNCGFTVPWSPYFADRFAGLPLKPVTLTHDGMTQRGELMITRTGLEGGVIYAYSAPLRDAITRQGSVTIVLDLQPGLTQEMLTQKLQAPRGNKSLSTYLRRAGFSPVTVALLREVTAPAELAGLGGAGLAERCKKLPMTLTADSGLIRAISTAGGIRRDALDDDFMLREKPGVFAAGEMLDWEAPTGGYLLQACFSTSVAAARGMLRFCAGHPAESASDDP